jgi:hypothetical protein
LPGITTSALASPYYGLGGNGGIGGSDALVPGNGGYPGGGGGGGGALSGNTAGGNGADGFAMMVTFF